MSIKDPYRNNQSSVTPNSAKLEDETPTNRMGTQNVIHPHCEILQSDKKAKLLIHSVMCMNHTTVHELGTPYASVHVKFEKL